MVPMYGLPEPGVCDVKVFRPAGNTTSWSSWVKPRGAQMIYMMAIGAGAGGGGGFTRATTADGAGGGGGGTGAIARFFGPACMVPDMLYIQAGLGGIGAAANGNGGAGGISYVSLGPFPAGSVANFTVDNNLFLMSNAAGAGGGAGGSGTTAGAAGAAGTIPVIGSQNRGGYAGMWFGTVGLVGFIGGVIADGAGAAATNVLTDGVPMSGGAGGSGSTGANVSGGNVTGAGIFNTILGGTATFPDGGGGYSWEEKSGMFLASTGGSGGAAIDAAQGGNGGKGGFPGSGGGGGGAGTTGGRGGDGGNGCVIIICW